MSARMRSLIKKVISKYHYHRLEDLYVMGRYLALYPTFVGSEFACPFCGGHFKRFLPFGSNLPVLKEKNVVGAGYRSNGRCPRCASFDRERLLYLYLKSETCVLHEPLRLLHVAPEKNLQRVLMARPKMEYVPADLDSPLALVKMDVTNIAYENNRFDVIICSHVLQDVPEDRKAMSELYRVLRSGGWAILQVPISLSLDRTFEDPTVTPNERAKMFGGMYHVRIYGKDFEDKLASVGFSVRRYSFVAKYGIEIAHRYGLLVDEELYIASKPGGFAPSLAT